MVPGLGLVAYLCLGRAWAAWTIEQAERFDLLADRAAAMGRTLPSYRRAIIVACLVLWPYYVAGYAMNRRAAR